ncbi:MAG: VWA domain-containing protein [Candidatus Gastranaerophilaceae bacterium]|jgi:Mg-chelatase subunit ChlD
MKKRILLIVFISIIFIINLAAKNDYYYKPIKSETNYSCQNQDVTNNYSTKDFQEDGSDKTLIIMDSSGSMSEKINGKSKILIAKMTLDNVLSQIAPDINLGLRVYGHKFGLLGFDACRASELVVPIGPNNIQKIKKEAYKLEPTGASPIIYSIQQALDIDFPMAGAGNKRIILISDGMETCGGSPCEYAVDLVRRGIDLKIDVVGFDLNDKEAISQLKCVALSTKGKFYSANDESELKNSLTDSLNVSKEVQGKVYIKH